MSETTQSPQLPEGYQAVESSNIQALAFKPTEGDPATGTLEVLFKNNTRYAYAFVPKLRFDDLLTAESVGKAFNTTIKNNDDYRAEKLPDFTPTEEATDASQAD